ncbi:hypothetical protein HDU92_004915 [Lobulomyces angularis]|nr:hypothetical protein HDU92_004915 [Lobulomyces angularis]
MKTFSYGVKARLEMQLYDLIKKLFANRETLVGTSQLSSIEEKNFANTSALALKKYPGFTCNNCGKVHDDQDIAFSRQPLATSKSSK